MTIYIVHGIVDGWAPGDPQVPIIYGIFTDKNVAKKICTITNGKIAHGELDYINPSYVQSIKELGL